MTGSHVKASTLRSSGSGTCQLVAARSHGTQRRGRRRAVVPEAPAVTRPVPRRASHEFDAGHRRVVPVAGTELQDARVTAAAFFVTWGDLGEELVGHVLVADEGD